MKKKLLYVGAIVFIAIIAQLLFSSNAKAATWYNFDISYEENSDGTITVLASSKDVEEVEIPMMIEDKVVTKIKSEGFKDCTKLEKITFPKTITEIGDSAFEGCTALSDIDIPEGISVIPEKCFMDCTSLKTVVIPYKVHTVEDYAFENCTGITDVYFNSKVYTLYGNSFNWINMADSTFHVYKDTQPEFYARKKIPDIEYLTPVESISISGRNSVSRSLSTKLTATVSPSNAFAQDVVWTSSDESIAEMWEDGTVVAHREGKVTITAMSKDGYDLKKTFVLNVTKGLNFGVSGKNVYREGGIIFYTKGNEKLNVDLYEYDETAKEYKKIGRMPDDAVITDMYRYAIGTDVDQREGITIDNKNKQISMTIPGEYSLRVEYNGEEFRNTIYVLDAKKWKEKIGIPFDDINMSDWYYSSVKYTYQNGMISGATDTEFRPSAKITRGMIVTILWRMEGSPKVTGIEDFTDVKGQYYYDAVRWAAKNGIVNGYGDGRFGPNANVTREQLATILCNYAKYKGKNTKVTVDTGKYKDWYKVSSFAKPAAQWAIKTGVITGKENGTKVDPQGTATRGEAAVMLYNYCTKIK